MRFGNRFGAGRPDEVGKLAPLLMIRIRTAVLPLVEQRNNASTVGLVDTRETSTWKQPAGQAAENTHRGG